MNEKELEQLQKENRSRDKIAIEAILRVAALERVLIANGLVKEEDILSQLAELSEDLVSVVQSSLNKNGE